MQYMIIAQNSVTYDIVIEIEGIVTTINKQLN